MHLREDLGRTVEQGGEAVPECIGLSLTRLDHEGAFTLAVTNEATAVLDAVQYLEGGPVVAAVEHRRWGETDVSDTLVGDRWPLFARACAASGVQRTHTLPVTMSDVLVGSVHVYAAENAFVGREEDLARLVDVMAQEVVTRSESGVINLGHAGTVMVTGRRSASRSTNWRPRTIQTGGGRGRPKLFSGPSKRDRCQDPVPVSSNDIAPS